MAQLFLSAQNQAVIFIGIQASGKSTFYSRRLAETHVHINRDILKTRHREETLTLDCLEHHASFAVDDTNLTKAMRSWFLEKAKQAGYEVIGLFFRSVISESVERNAKREGKACIPSHAIAASSNKLELPSLAEGFDSLWYVAIGGDDFLVSEWRA